MAFSETGSVSPASGSDRARQRRKFGLRKWERGHASECSVLNNLRDLAFITGSQAAIIGERWGPISARPALPMASRTKLVEPFFRGRLCHRRERR